MARRLQDFYAEAETALEFEPQNFQQMAGLVCFYDTGNWVYLRVSRDEQLGKTLNILTCDNGHYDEPLAQEIPIEGLGRVYLRVRFARETFSFAYSANGQDWQPIPLQFPAYKLSDDYCRGLGFTGTFIGLCAQDLSGSRLPADFDFFSYRAKE
ncbi:Beta-xylosidase [Meiothermus granaticius NBRC 107808]|uniref:Beta-xylosidase n=1 Tax=Meiothermus granaticius NBRC 107808 TaxID=1227551 RepID=A0A399F6C0_9DEIN|nr:Beta-xylosidase [Meiothermus granaticius NBRC 107808]